MNLTRITRKRVTLNLTVKDAQGHAVTPAAVAVAVILPHLTPTAATVWTDIPLEGGAYRVLLAGPDADPTGALVVPAASKLWARITDTPEVDAVAVDRLTFG